jgi:short subunit dehydrogenase-like uncharacterized protein
MTESGVAGTGSVVVVGGYGAVGRVVASRLAGVFPGRVVVAGRDAGRAESLARSLPGLSARRADVGRPGDVERLLAGAAVVVMCVERGNEELARACLGRGIHYVDISASLDVLDRIARLDAVAKGSGAAAVLSVGLAPGLTNLLARHCVDRLPAARSVDIAILLGLAGDHGPDSVRWTVQNLAAPVARGRSAPRRARAVARLPGFGRRTVHPFPFSDQYTLSRSLDRPVTTRMCFDSAAVTSVLFGLRAAGFFRLLARVGATAALAAASSRIRLGGGDRFAVQATAGDDNGGRVTVAVTGREECRVTGVVAAQVAERLLGTGAPPGVHHIDQVVDAGPFLAALGDHGLSVHEEHAAA